jgi:hypothetical protein
VNPPVRPTDSIDRHRPTGTAAINIGLYAVAACAVILSFSALYDLAMMCGFGPKMSALVPIMVDAGAAVASAVWLGTSTPKVARWYAGAMANVLLASTVLGNAVAHFLAAYHLRPNWMTIVTVGALAPATLAATLRLRSLFRSGDREQVEDEKTAAPPVVEETSLAAEVVGPEPAPMVEQPTTLPVELLEVVPTPPVETDVVERARKLVATEGAGRKRLMALGLTEHQARRIAATKTNGKVVA